ncbi:class I SAM-dependent methyltransferase [Mammaliicoccus lentus]|uniref:class I SAM-dependent methyltransferase n=1 Tax=Mammaliicoccus lentus TaxID=42858 RepID=UPI002A59E4CB|nr:class I SAM-dependent methyltransferase [Mammaliicoccus lentus]WQL56167.1 class I SAM-dependent methyltransferase [Mammaliicoccus lentus]
MSKLEGIPESMLIPLAAKANEYYKSSPIIYDPYSLDIMREVDYSFENFSKDWMSQLGICIRTEILDEMVLDFVTTSKNPFVINIGCGLDTRLSRLDLKKVPWIDIDLPESINARRRFFYETDYYKMIGKSMFDYSWLKDIRSHPSFKEDSNILIIFEGVLMYFEELDIKNLLREITKTLQHQNVKIAAEFCSKTMTNHSEKHPSVSKLSSKLEFKYGFNKISELKNILPKHLNVVNEINYFERYPNRWRWFRLFKYIPYLNNRYNNKIVLLKNVQNFKE